MISREGLCTRGTLAMVLKSGSRFGELKGLDLDHMSNQSHSKSALSRSILVLCNLDSRTPVKLQVVP